MALFFRKNIVMSSDL